ncbi:hypothetical protein AB1Y20_009825 [Prymnesium parvum]|uniref:Apple domain-containing protein n=1 Tax=Prymnesium parvum TaxID=97485 RepID=A0AB34K5N9_PRYPA
MPQKAARSPARRPRARHHALGQWEPVLTDLEGGGQADGAQRFLVKQFAAVLMIALGVLGLWYSGSEPEGQSARPVSAHVGAAKGAAQHKPHLSSSLPRNKAHLSTSPPPDNVHLSTSLPLDQAHLSPSLLSPATHASPSPRAPPELLLQWTKHPATNCWWGGNGAEAELEKPQGSAAPGIASLSACQASCRQLYPACGGVLFEPARRRCYRKGTIDLPKCHAQTELDLYTLAGPSPPSQPPPPPLPPRAPIGRGVNSLNKQFRDGAPSNLLEQVGVLMHQWDGQEVSATPWRMCEHNCMCQGAFINGRISTMVIYKDLNKRPDRKAVPLPFGNRGGILLHPSYATVDCLYGIDGATYHLDNPAKPGCSESFCDPNNILDQNGNVFCGFNGAPATAWRPSDMKLLLETHARSGVQWHAPGFHSGYNEIILNSKKHNLNLPHSIAGFFAPLGQSTVTADLGYSIVIDVVQAHRAFLAEYGITEAEVPLVWFNPSNWEEPFSRMNV